MKYQQNNLNKAVKAIKTDLHMISGMASASQNEQDKKPFNPVGYLTYKKQNKSAVITVLDFGFPL